MVLDVRCHQRTKGLVLSWVSPTLFFLSLSALAAAGRKVFFFSHKVQIDSDREKKENDKKKLVWLTIAALDPRIQQEDWRRRPSPGMMMMANVPRTTIEEDLTTSLEPVGVDVVLGTDKHQLGDDAADTYGSCWALTFFFLFVCVSVCAKYDSVISVFRVRYFWKFIFSSQGSRWRTLMSLANRSDSVFRAIYQMKPNRPNINLLIKWRLECAYLCV